MFASPDDICPPNHRSLDANLHNKVSEQQEDICMKKFDIRAAQLQLGAVRAQVCAVEIFSKVNWRARSQSHVIDYGYETINDVTLARAEMRRALARKYIWQRAVIDNVVFKRDNLSKSSRASISTTLLRLVAFNCCFNFFFFRVLSNFSFQSLITLGRRCDVKDIF